MLNYFPIEMTMSLVQRLFAVIIMSPIFVVPGAFVAVVGGWAGQVYIAAQLSVKRYAESAIQPAFSLT
jgi:hypothetical protein